MFATTHVSFMCNQITFPLDYSYLTLAAPHTATIEIKKSKFITTAWPATSPEEVSGCLHFRRKTHLPDAARWECKFMDRSKASLRLSMQALQLGAAAKDPAASHNCFAYKIGEQVTASCAPTPCTRAPHLHH
jgi:putative IMPACT (imprinted ancient) family translation regulator